MKNAKMHSTTFYLETTLLQGIDEIAKILGVSRSIVVERAVFGVEKGFENAEHKIRPKKAKKKISSKRIKYKKIKQKCKEAEIKQKCLFD